MIRLFVAVPLPTDIREKLSILQGQLKKILPPMSWVHPDSIHLTLKFLGFVNPSRVPELLSVLATIGHNQKKFSLEIQGLGVFPHRRRPRILWVGITDKTRGLQDVVLNIEAALEPLEFPPEDKSYHPHLTLGRVKHDNTLVGSALVENKVLEVPRAIGPMPVDQFILFQSDLHASGAVYSPLGTVKLLGYSAEQQGSG